MERRLKERLTGAVVLLLLAIIFVPMILDNSAQDDIEITGTNIPPEPDVEFKSAVLPVEVVPQVEPPAMPIATTELDNNVVTSPDNAIPVEQLTPPAEAVQLEAMVVDDNNVPALNTSGDSATRGMSAWIIQLGSFTSQANADKLVRELQTQGFPAYIEKVTTDRGIDYKVRIGPELSRPAAEDMVKNLKLKMKLDGIILSFP